MSTQSAKLVVSKGWTSWRPKAANLWLGYSKSTENTTSLKETLCLPVQLSLFTTFSRDWCPISVSWRTKNTEESTPKIKASSWKSWKWQKNHNWPIRLPSTTTRKNEEIYRWLVEKYYQLIDIDSHHKSNFPEHYIPNVVSMIHLCESDTLEVVLLVLLGQQRFYLFEVCLQANQTCKIAYLGETEALPV